MTIDRKTKLAAAFVAVLVAAGFAGYAWTSFRLARMSSAVDAAKSTAASEAKAAAEQRARAEALRGRIDELERGLAEIEAIARRQDEELEKLSQRSGAARRDVERARNVRAIGTNARELCQRLAELGHGC